MASPHGGRGTPRLRIVKRTADGGEEVLVSNELDLGREGGGSCGPYPDPQDVVPVIALNDDPACTLLQEAARQGAWGCVMVVVVGAKSRWCRLTG
jgi:hypothetical protein